MPDGSRTSGKIGEQPCGCGGDERQFHQPFRHVENKERCRFHPHAFPTRTDERIGSCWGICAQAVSHPESSDIIDGGCIESGCSARVVPAIDDGAARAVRWAVLRTWLSIHSSWLSECRSFQSRHYSWQLFGNYSDDRLGFWWYWTAWRRSTKSLYFFTQLW